METSFDALVALVCFAVLLASGAWIFCAEVGGSMRGAIVPLLFIPLVSDWVRFAAKVSHTRSFGMAVGIYVLLIAFLWWKRRGHRNEGDVMLCRDKRWWLALAFFVVVHMIVRTWVFTGSVPNPADDTYGGYKANALLNSAGWPSSHPEAPELPISYYYYVYTWPAGLAALAGVSLKAGWWVTAVVFCAVGGMLVFEVLLPRLRERRSVFLAALAVINGCSLSLLLALALRMPPRDWGHEVEVLTTPTGLYMRTPQSVGTYWAPFAVFASGVLLVTLIFLVDSLSSRQNRTRLGFCVLGLGSLAGYCTFHLIGLALAVVPVLAIAAIGAGRKVAWGWFLRLGTIGFAAIAACLPLLFDLAKRSAGTRYYRFRDPLHIWLQSAWEKLPVWQVGGLLLWSLVAILAANVLLLPILARSRARPSPPLVSVLLGVFALGAAVSLFGVTDDFVPKFGHFLGTAVIAAFFLVEAPPRWARALLVAGLFGPVLMLLNCVRANFFSPKWDAASAVIDRTTVRTGESVVYDVDFVERRRRVPWVSVLPFFSRSRFLVPADQVDDQGQNFLRDPAALALLPGTEIRLKQWIGDAPTHLLLTTPDHPPLGEELYHSDWFSLQRIEHGVNLAPAP